MKKTALILTFALASLPAAFGQAGQSNPSPADPNPQGQPSPNSPSTPDQRGTPDNPNDNSANRKKRGDGKKKNPDTNPNSPDTNPNNPTPPPRQ
ncbi:MAG: hypothetical protein C5B51_14955 [Terriglobia bacterium]|nr:MAG: hypothetical protein C5B51_14955 [Terriglobia bacterium]